MRNCDLCNDTGTLTLYAVCHPTAPLRVDVVGDGTMILYCYVPECSREVARFKAEEYVPGEFQCPQCKLRMATKSIDGVRVGIDVQSQQLLCLQCRCAAIPITWREACHEAFLVNQRLQKRVDALQDAWPSDLAMPFEEDPAIAIFPATSHEGEPEDIVEPDEGSIM